MQHWTSRKQVMVMGVPFVRASETNVAGTIIDAILVFLGGVITGLIGILIERDRYNGERRTKHLEQIQQLCIEPVRLNLQDVKKQLSNAESRPDPNTLQTLLDDDIPKWERLSLMKKSDGVLIGDLGTHYADMPKTIEDTERTLRDKSANYFKCLYELSSSVLRGLNNQFDLGDIHKDLSVQEKQVYDSLSTDERQRSVSPMVKLAFDDNPENRSEALTELRRFVGSRERLELFKKMAVEFGKSPKATEAKALRTALLGSILSCETRLIEILHESKLKGKCRFV